MGSTTLFPGLFQFSLDPYLILLRVKQGGIKYHFWVFGMTQPEIKPRSPGPLANTLTIIISAFIWSGIYIYIYIYKILLNTLSSGKSCLVVPGVAVLPWTTETVLSPLVGGWWGQGIARAFTSCMRKFWTLRLSWKQDDSLKDKETLQKVGVTSWKDRM